MSELAERDVLVRRLIDLQAVRSDGGSLRTTRRFQAAMARAAAELAREGDDRFDLRIPVAAALLALHAASGSSEGGPPSDELLASLVALVLPIEARELAWMGPPP